MKTYYKCSDCGQFCEETGIDRITYSRDELSSGICVWIHCKECEKKSKEKRK